MGLLACLGLGLGTVDAVALLVLLPFCTGSGSQTLNVIWSRRRAWPSAILVMVVGARVGMPVCDGKKKGGGSGGMMKPRLFLAVVVVVAEAWDCLGRVNAVAVILVVLPSVEMREGPWGGSAGVSQHQDASTEKEEQRECVCVQVSCSSFSILPVWLRWQRQTLRELCGDGEGEGGGDDGWGGCCLALTTSLPHKYKRPAHSQHTRPSFIPSTCVLVVFAGCLLFGEGEASLLMMSRHRWYHCL